MIEQGGEERQTVQGADRQGEWRETMIRDGGTGD